MKSSFPSHTSAASAVRVQKTAHSSLRGTVPRIIFWQVISTATQRSSASQRSVYEAGIYKVKLDRSSEESTSCSRSVLSLTGSDGCLIRSPTRCPGPGSALLQSAAAVCQSALTSCRSFDGRGGVTETDRPRVTFPDCSFILMGGQRWWGRGCWWLSGNPRAEYLIPPHLQ